MSGIPHKQAFQTALADWYRHARRPLPWRTAPSLYRTVVSEFMAQQTQIKTMLPYFSRWMQRFPDFEALAQAPETLVLKHWEGLGYYSRARNLHKLAQTWVKMDPKPRTRAAWQTLPGIGPYTSAAIASINFHEPVAVIDGNVVRILARLSGETRRFKNSGEAVKSLTALADELLDSEHPGDHNQAMMELGATVCLKRKPLCTICPVASFCVGRSHPEVDTIPRIQRRATEHVVIERAWCVRNNALLLHRIPADAKQLAGQYELPKLTTVKSVNPKGPLITTKTRGITHRRIKEPIYRVDADKSQCGDLFWVPFDQLISLTLSGPHRRWIEEIHNRQTA